MIETPSAFPETSGELTIERAVPDDAFSIMQLKREAWLAAYTSETHGVSREDIEKKFPEDSLQMAAENWAKGIASESDQSDRATFVARLDGKVVGFTSPATEEGQKRIGQLYVSPTAQGRGIGGKLIREAIGWHGRDEDIYLQVVSYNTNAIDFYKTFGFEPTGVTFPAGFDEAEGIKLLPQIEMRLPKTAS